MDRVIRFPGKDQKGREHVITDQPMRLRWGPWRTGRIIQVHVASAAVYEEYRLQCLESGADPSGQMPPHFTLDGGMSDTALGLLRHRGDSRAQVKVCFLAALLEALLNIPSSVLRSDLIRRVYQEVERLSQDLGFRWRGGESHFIPPINADASDPKAFARMVASLGTLREFFDTIDSYASQRYQSLAKDYVFYFPPRLRNVVA